MKKMDLPTVLLSGALLIPSCAALTKFSDDPASCEIIGDTDLYGIGVRLSFYFQFGAALLAMVFGVKEELSNVRRAVIITTLAVLINTVISTLHGSLAILEWYIVTQLTLFLAVPCFIPSFKLNLNEESDDDDDKDGEDGEDDDDDEKVFDAQTREDAGLFGIFFILETFNVAIQPWLYFRLSRQGYREGCEVKTFFFAAFNIYNRHFITYIKVLTVIGCVTAPLLIVTAVFSLAYSIKTNWKGEKHEGRTSLTSIATGVASGISMAFFGVLAIVFVEEVIHVNHIDLSDVTLTSASQLIVFLVGLFNFVAVGSKCLMSIPRAWKAIKRELDLDSDSDSASASGVHAVSGGHQDTAHQDPAHQDASHQDASHQDASHQDAPHQDAQPNDTPHDNTPHNVTPRNNTQDNDTYSLRSIRRTRRSASSRTSPC